MKEKFIVKNKIITTKMYCSAEMGRGFNTGVVIYDLQKIRQSKEFAVGYSRAVLRKKGLNNNCQKIPYVLILSFLMRDREDVEKVREETEEKTIGDVRGTQRDEK